MSETVISVFDRAVVVRCVVGLFTNTLHMLNRVFVIESHALCGRAFIITKKQIHPLQIHSKQPVKNDTVRSIFAEALDHLCCCFKDKVRQSDWG